MSCASNAPALPEDLQGRSIVERELDRYALQVVTETGMASVVACVVEAGGAQQAVI